MRTCTTQPIRYYVQVLMKSKKIVKFKSTVLHAQRISHRYFSRLILAQAVTLLRFIRINFVWKYYLNHNLN